MTVDQVLDALAEPRRRDILWLLRSGEQAAGDIADEFPDVTRPAISQHLSVLRRAGLVHVRPEGTRRFYRTDPRGLLELRRYLEAFWDERLELLKRAAEAEERRQESADRNASRD